MPWRSEWIPHGDCKAVAERRRKRKKKKVSGTIV
jgi:hypothetical protein